MRIRGKELQASPGRRALYALAFSCAPAVAQTPPPVPMLPPAHGPRDSAIDVGHVALDLRFDLAKEHAYGNAAIRLTVIRATHVVRLDAAQLSISRITLADGTPLKFNYDGSVRDDALEIILDRGYLAGERLTLKIDYRTNWVNRADPNNIWGSFGKGLRFFKPSTTVPVKRPQIWSMGLAEGSRYWFPGRDDPSDVRTTELIATVARPLTVISNGDLIGVKENADGTRSFHWRMDTPYSSWRTSLVVGEYADIRQDADGVPFHTFAYPDEQEAARATIERLPDMARFFAALTGAKYPWKRYSQVMVQDLGDAVGHAMAPTITDNMIDDFRTHADYYYSWDVTEGEALASQWFGGLIAPRSWPDLWLSHSFSHYLTGLYDEHRNGRDEFLLWQIQPDQNAIIADWKTGIRHPIVTSNYKSADAFAFDNYATLRGALVLHMLRKQLGEAGWQQALRRYVTANTHRPVTTADFRAAVEETSGKPMGWFFDQWLYKMGHPVFAVTKDYDAAAQQVLLSVRQTQREDASLPYPQAGFFKGNIDIEIDDTVTTVALDAKAENVFRLPSAQAPKLVNFDFESSWIKEVEFVKSFDELLYQFENDRDILGRQWAMQQLAARVKEPANPTNDKARFRASLMRVVTSQVYWRLRSAAISQFLAIAARDAEPLGLDPAEREALAKLATLDRPWIRTGAIRTLGLTRDPTYASLYIRALDDQSDRVINAAATALGQSKSPKAFDTLIRLIDKPSWKSQSLISALNGLKELGDPRGVEIAMKALSNLKLPRWWLATSVWDYRLAAAETLVALGKGNLGFPIVAERLKASIAENDYNDMFGNAQLIATLADPRGREAIGLLRTRFADDPNALKAVDQYAKQLDDAVAAKAK